MLLSVHVPKCAGTSFRHVLDENYGKRVWYNYGAVFSRDSASAALVPEGTSIIHGHFLADAFDDVLPERTYMTWVRHPVERVVSNYEHFLRSPDMRDTCCRRVHEEALTLRQFADIDWMQNLICRYLARKPVEAFQFVGIAEDFTRSIQQFGRVYGLRSALRSPRVNVNPQRVTDRYDLSPGDYAYILERNLADMDWYRQAVRRLYHEPLAGSVSVA